MNRYQVDLSFNNFNLTNLELLFKRDDILIEFITSNFQN